MNNLKTLDALISSFQKLPGIGEKTAERLAYSVLSWPLEDVEEFSSSLIKAKTDIHPCPICGLFTENDTCDVCSDKNRDHKVITVVSESKDVLAIEKMGTYNGLYHVLGGNISINKQMGPEKLNIDHLLKRIKEGKIEEVILALNVTIDGETTALYLQNLLKDFPVKVTRLACGLSMGSSLDYIDPLTLRRAFEGRK